MSLVPDTNSFSLQDVVNVVLPSNNNLSTCINESVESYFDLNYAELPATKLSDFRNYGYKSTPFIIECYARGGSVTLPYLSSGTYSGTIDWGDGTVVENTYANRTHTYASTDYYDVTILGDCDGWDTQNSPDFIVDKNNYDLINVKQWGDKIKLGIRSFYKCSNLSITATDILNLSESNSFYRFFYGCTQLLFNNSVNSWDTIHVINFTDVFAGTKFNQPLNNWDTFNVYTMNGMFSNTPFNQDISAWNYRSLSQSYSLSNFMTNSNYNPTYYDNLLIKWAKDPSEGGLQPNIIQDIGMNGIKYTSAGAAARQSILDNNKAQVINDGGQV